MAKAKSNRKQQLIIIAVFALIMCVAIAVTSAVVLRAKPSAGADPYRNVTMTDAYVDCEKRLKKDVGKRLDSYEPDNLSTRFDQNRGLYLIFFKADVRDEGARTTSINYVTCEVSGKGKIALMEYSAEDGSPGTASENSSPFGYDP